MREKKNREIAKETRENEEEEEKKRRLAQAISRRHNKLHFLLDLHMPLFFLTAFRFPFTSILISDHNTK